MVATYHDDLTPARLCGLRTACIERAYELGKARPKARSNQPDNDQHATDLNDMAQVLGC